MNMPEAIRVDEASGRIAWEEGDSVREAFVEGAVAARYDPERDRLMVLTRTSERGAVAIVSRDGRRIANVPPPEGYSLSHFAGDEPVLVGQGEAPDGGWRDWHFALGEDGTSLERLGPAY